MTTIEVSIDHRCDLGSRYWWAKRAQIGEQIAPVSRDCAVTADCGVRIQVGEKFAVWEFTRTKDNTTTLGWLCERCDIDLQGQAEEGGE
jgi:hypothetical protein